MAAARFKADDATGRPAALRHWIGSLGLDPAQLQAIPGDASLRHYWRLLNPPRIVMDAPPAVEDTLPFIRMAHRLREIGLRAPGILAADTAQGFLLLEDFGSLDLKGAIDLGTDPTPWYQTAIEAIVRMQAGGRAYHASPPLPPFDAARLKTELELFPDWYLQRHLGRELNAGERALLDEAFGKLIDNALAQPQVWVHRDYHARNLMCLADGEVGILDFQDAVLGPISYDLVSLLQDRYWDWPTDWLNARIQDYLSLARAAGLPVGSDVQFRQWLGRMGLQRNLKIVGIFARLRYRDDKQGYIEMIPRFWHYVLEAARQDPELAAFSDWLASLPQPENIACVP
ncbi:aminoglycoside phosphotransferase family protein [Thermithiobacillus plumbiphilus]|uniref:Phosphotransferase n=1 Tax=Thermithiobacillus plumbiphilus TaxID=1729899 RepID=A0ABU9D7C6_9PROT